MDVLLSNNYKFWYHSITDKDYSLKSYINLSKDLKDQKIRTINELWQIYKKIDNGNFKAGMFFLMRDEIMPTWEDKNNVNGGYWSLRIIKDGINEIWKKISAAFVGNLLMKNPENMSYITGISLSPKIDFCTIKIWNNDNSKNDRNLLNDFDFLDKNSILYRSHKN